MDAALWAVRNVAEYAYCPRLFHFMTVEGVMLPSVDTEEGKLVHHQVDAPSRLPDEDQDPERPRTLRSFALVSDAFGLTGKLDLCEMTGDEAIPIEYKKGRPRRRVRDEIDEAGQSISSNDCEPWPTDRVQVGLQALLLQEAGYRVRRARFWYASTRQKLEIVVDNSLLQEARDCLAAAKSCAESGTRPLPLVNDPRCQGCSLQPLCLPDEVNLERQSDPQAAPRRLWPPHQDGLQLVAMTTGSKIGVRQNALRVTDKDGELIKEVPLAHIDALAVLGHVQVTTQAIHALSDRGTPIAWLSAAGRLTAIIDPLDSVSALVRKAQVLCLEDPARALELAKAVTLAKIHNQRTVLLRNLDSPPARLLNEMSRCESHAAKADTLDVVRGYEGQAAALYFEHFPAMFKSDLAAEFAANGRQRRPPPDPINATLSFAYSILSNECVSALRLARLEPALGALHSSKPARPALALDLMEPFRPLIADSVCLSLFNRGEIGAGHFLRSASGCAFSQVGMKAFFIAYGRRMETEVTHPVFDYRLSYRRMIHLHARLVAAWMIGDIPQLSFLTTR